MMLNEEQNRAANFRNGICSVVAVPGSGKTRTMMERIGRLVNDHGISPENILGLTFTKNAAEEMRSRLALVLDEKADRVLLMTIHGFCYMLLKREGFAFEILNEREQFILIKKIMKDLRIKDISPGLAITEISLAKNNLMTADDILIVHENDKTMYQIAEIFKSYDKAKKKMMQFDFDDLLVQVHGLLSDNELKRERYGSIYQHILVDEYQDTNPLQNEILRLLLSGHEDSSFWVAGDDWQSIYGFMGASIGNIIRFKDLFENAEELHLTTNYRSTPQILDACRNLISKNVRKVEKELRTDNKPGNEVTILECANEEDEARTIASEIQGLVSSGKYSHKDIAILYRCNYQSRAVEEIFSEDRIPYHIQNGMNFYERREIKVLLDYLRIIDNPNTAESAEALKRIANAPVRYISRVLMTEIEVYADENDMSLYEALRAFHVDNPFIRKQVRLMSSFLERMIEIKDTLSTPELIQLIRTTLDLDRFITDDDLPSPDDLKIANMNELQLAATRFSISELLTHSEMFKENQNHDKNGVSLMTVHKAKGLEFPVVFVIGLVEGILPSRKGELEEERRIMFVAISRAMTQLYLSHYTSCQNGQVSKKSMFLDEIKTK